MVAYKQLKDKHQNEMDAFPLGAAFSKEQFTVLYSKNKTDTLPSITAMSYETGKRNI